MWPRILIGGLVGGLLMFIMGAVNHAGFHLQERTFLNLPESESFSERLKSQDLKHGLYSFPDMPTEAEQGSATAMEAYNERYGAGPSGMLLIVHRGKIFMPELLGKEFVSNLIAAFIASWIVSLAGPDVGLGRRWLALVGMGLIGWFSIAASYGIWYRFPHDFLHDELICVFLEWLVAGAAIADIVRPKPMVANVNEPKAV